MAKKGKKGSDSDQNAGDGQKEPSQQRSIEYYELRHKDNVEKLDQGKLKLEFALKENEMLTKAQTKINHDKQDIVEFLNIKVLEHEKMISELECKCHNLEEDKKALELKSRQEIENIKAFSRQEVDTLQYQCSKYKSELFELTEFSEKKAEMENQLGHYKQLLEKKEQEYKETINAIDRKIIQDKNRMKREMLQKVNEAVANFRRVADQQMAETTKRAIRENMIISSQLKKMSIKVVELVAENETLSQRVKKYQTNSSLLISSEKELVKRNFANQKVIKMLIDKLKESNQMLEIAFENDQKKNELTEGYTEDGRPILTDTMKEEIEALQYDYNVLAGRLNEVQISASELEMVIHEASEAGKSSNLKEVLEYLETNVFLIDFGLKMLTTFNLIEKSERSSVNTKEDSASMQSEQLDMSRASKESRYEIEPVKDDNQHPTMAIEQAKETDFDEQKLEEAQNLEEPLENLNSNSQTRHEADATAIDFDKELKELHEYHQAEFKKSIESVHAESQSRNQNESKYQEKVNKNYEALVSLIPVKKAIELKRDGSNQSTGTQTEDISFGASTTPKYLLGEVRPWGPRAEYLPKAGVGLYQPRFLKKQATEQKVEPLGIFGRNGKPLRM